MPDDQPTLKWLADQSGLPEARFRFYRQADETIFQSIELGVLFLMAFWSGPAHVFFKQLTKIVARLDPAGRIEIVVVDTDGIPRLYDLPPFAGKLAGSGEAAWVRKGKLVAVFTAQDCPRPLESYEAFTKALLSDAKA